MAKKADKIRQSNDKPKKSAPVVAAPAAPAPATSGPVPLTYDGKSYLFDINDPVLANWVEESSMTSGGYPYKKKMEEDEYLKELELLQIELVKLQEWQIASKERIVIVFEGRDAAGKGGTINAVRENMNPRTEIGRAHV